MAIDPSDITLEDDGSGGRYVYRIDGEEAEMTFRRAGDNLVVVDHTGVPHRFRGQGVAAALVAKSVEDFRAAGLKVLPLCPFVVAQFRRHPEWADLLQGANA